MSYSYIHTHKHIPYKSYLSTLLVCVDALNQVPIKIRGRKFFSIYGSEHVRASEYSGHFRSPRRVMSGSK